MSSLISIALCTYNGAKYLEAQLQSILNQTVLPYEIVICDDISKDTTLDVARFVAEKSAIPIRIYKNESNLGVTQNFAKAISLCEGDFIALSDQDDIWLPDKLEKQVGFLQNPQNKHIQAVFSNLSLVDDNLEPLNSTMWQALKFTPELQQQWKNGGAFESISLVGNIVTGCTLMIRKSFREEVMPFIARVRRFRIHDELIALLAAKDDALGFIEEPTVLYRQHANQVIGAPKLNTTRVGLPTLKTDDLAILLEEIDEIMDIAVTFKVDPRIIAKLEKKRNHVLKRVHMPAAKGRRIPIILGELFSGNYKQYSNSIIGAGIRDFLR